MTLEMSQTSLPSSNHTEINLNELIARRHAAYIGLPEELCPASRPSSPTSEERVLTLKTRFVAAVNTAGGDTTNPKWGYVSRMARLGCTSRKYVGIMPGIRIGEGRNVSVGQNFEWELQETEEGWAAYERKWEEAVIREEERKKAKAKATEKPTSKVSLTSKYFNKSVDEDPGRSLRFSAPSSKAEVIREKVERWQAQVITTAAAPDAPMSQEIVNGAPSVIVDKNEANRRVPQGGKVQAPLGFRVVKRSNAASAKGGSSASTKPKLSPVARVPTSSREGSQPSPPNQPQNLVPSLAPERAVGQPESAPIAVHITEIPELSFLPPSFPSQLQTSTPPLKDRRHKPSPIAPCSPPPSSPQSARSVVPTKGATREKSSSLFVISPMRKPLKRARTPHPMSEEDRMDISEAQSPSTKSPVGKKARMGPEQEPASSGPIAVPPSTPPLTSSPCVAPITPVSRGKDLGNAKGLPVPTTPDPCPLPTLTELLASSRRSRLRPRPPSRKATPYGRASSSIHAMNIERDSELPKVTQTDERKAREHTPEPSPTKTYFSSPASGSSDSPGSAMHRPQSPVSPLFTQHPSAFAPRFVSSQRAVGNVDDPFGGGEAQTQASLMRGSSGFFAMGYSSQFDVEGHVEQVSELLERDVDFNGWLRDLGTEDGEEHVHDMPATDAGAVGAGF